MTMTFVFITLYALPVLLFVGVTALTVRIAQPDAMRGSLLIGILLPVLLFCLEQLARTGWSYDLVMRTPVHLYVPEAPVMAAYGILFLGLGVAAVVCLAVVIARAAVVWRDDPSRRSMLALACLPAVALYAFQHHQGVQELRRVERDGYERARQRNERRLDACERESAAAKEGCRKYVQTHSGLPGDSDAELTANGRRWAMQHRVVSENACRATDGGFDPRPAFAAGCRAAVADMNRELGDRWAREHQLEDPKDCEQDAQASEHDNDFLAGCARGVHARLREQGFNWASSQLIFDPTDCHSRAPGTAQNTDFVAGCESHASHLSVSERSAEGSLFAKSKQIQRAAECYTRLPTAPPEFKKGCEDEVRNTRREAGKQWAQTQKFTNDDDCLPATAEWQRIQEEQPEFVAGCRNEVIRQRMGE